MNAVKIFHGNCLDVLGTLPAESVHTCVTSPPYWGQRDYGTATWQGGDAGCDHLMAPTKPRSERPNPSGSGIGRGGATWGAQEGASRVYRHQCGRCGAVRVDEQIGMEPTPGEYVESLVEVFRAVRRVLRDDGTLWLNLGDSYCHGLPGPKRQQPHGNAPESDALLAAGRVPAPKGSDNGHATRAPGLKSKDLVGIPWMVAFALRDDGWYLRSDIVWAKPNGMPESVTDRPTRAHEFIFLFSKSETYHYDAAAIAEPFADERLGNPGTYSRTSNAFKGKNNDRGDLGLLNNGGGWNLDGAITTRNKRDVWTVTSQPFSEPHFATFPEDLIKPCILAGCPDRGVVLDPFFGAGTTGVVAGKNNVRCIGIELNAEYVNIAQRRLAQDVLVFERLQ